MAYPRAIDLNGCGIGERTISYASYITIPKPQETPEEVFNECCYINRVFASTTDSSPYKNDYTGLFHQRQLVNEQCEFSLIQMSTGNEFVLNNNTYGEYKMFGVIKNNPNLKTFILSWRKVLQLLGTGPYKIIKKCRIAGLDIEIEGLVYNLYQYSVSAANGTARLEMGMLGLMEKLGVDFTGSDFKSTIRVPGFFGNREPTFEEDNLIARSYEARQISMKQTNAYKFQTNLVPYCITDQIFDLFLFSDNLSVSDYNLNNHSYQYKLFPVKIDANEGTVYNPKTRKSVLNLVFKDKFVNNNKRNY